MGKVVQVYKFLAVLSAPVALYSFILWLYCVLMTILFPQYQTAPISYYINIPQNLIADVAFPLSFIAAANFFIYWWYNRENRDDVDS